MTETKRENIRNYYQTHKTSYRKVGRMFKVSHTTVMNIIRSSPLETEQDEKGNINCRVKVSPER